MKIDGQKLDIAVKKKAHDVGMDKLKDDDAMRKHFGITYNTLRSYIYRNRITAIGYVKLERAGIDMKSIVE